MTIHHEDANVTLHHGDCLDVLRSLPDASVDSVVTDPPYGLEFMGKSWDGADGFRRSLNPADAGRDNAFGRASRTSPEYRAGALFQEWCEAWAAECLRVLKPGGHLLAFGGTRTWHRLACAVEDAGFEVRDSIAWLYGSGFPKSLDVSKAIDKAAGAEREVVGASPHNATRSASSWQAEDGRPHGMVGRAEGERLVTAPATDAAREWAGWGTALKPGHEPCVVARKPVENTAILDVIGSHLDALEATCRHSASDAATSSAPSRAGSPAAKTATAPASAATQPEDEPARTTPIGEAAGLPAQTGTSSSESMGATFSSTVTSWRACWAELCDLTSTSTTATTSETTTALRTLSSSLSRLTDESTHPSATSPHGLTSLASAVDNLFASVVCGLRATLALSAAEPATGSTQGASQVEAASVAAFEPVVVARKPLVGTVAANVTTHGTGALNIDACRVDVDEADPLRSATYVGSNPGTAGHTMGDGWANQGESVPMWSGKGRWPANVILDSEMAAVLDEQSGTSKSPPVGSTCSPKPHKSGSMGGGIKRNAEPMENGYGDKGGASRFFYVAKAPKKERPSYLRLACKCEGSQPETVPAVRQEGDTCPDCGAGVVRFSHPTVKPLSLMRWLVRLVTPPGGTVLEPFPGSGTTVEACLLEDFKVIAIEKGGEYLPLILARIARQAEPMPELAEIMRQPDAARAITEQLDGQLDIFGEATA